MSWLVGALLSVAPTVVVCLPGASPELVSRVVAELRLSGFEPLVEADSTLVDLDHLDELAAARGAVGVVALRAGDAQAALVVAERVTGKTVQRRVLTPQTSAADLAVKLVELLRASLLELELQGFEPRVAPPREARAFVQEAWTERARAKVRVSGGGWKGLGWATLLPGVGVGAEWSITRWLRARGDGWFTVAPASITSSVGSAALVIHRADLGVRLEPWDGLVTGWVAVGGGAEWLSLAGTSAARGFVGASTWWARPIVTTRLGAAWRPLRMLSVELELTAAAAFETFDVRLGGEIEGRWAALSLGASLGVAVTVPGT